MIAPEHVRPVNLLGGVAWWLTVRRGGVGQPRPALVRTYDRFVVPVTRFVERTGKAAAIGSLEQIEQIVDGAAGTQVVPQ